LLYESKYKVKYPIKKELTWIKQKDFITSNILPKISKELNKKYKVSNHEIMKMLRGRWRSRNNTWRLRKNGNAKRESRRVRKNTEMAKVIFLKISDLILM
jgi:hypothetical protein